MRLFPPTVIFLSGTSFVQSFFNSRNGCKISAIGEKRTPARYPTSFSTFSSSSDNDARTKNDMSSGDEAGLPTRREFLSTSLLSATFTMVGSLPASAISQDGEPDFDCLSDLPPIPTNCVRVFLCRHGQTENNRLNIVQGARVDPPINSNGMEMARRLGVALSRRGGKSSPATPLTVFFHSPLLRTKQTAQIAAEQLLQRSRVALKMLPSLKEVDIGPVMEGQSSNRGFVLKTYAKWAVLGEEDVHPKGGGESLRDVLKRIDETLLTFARVDDESVVAVTHSVFLRILLATVSNISLTQAAIQMKQSTACINVLDVVTEPKTSNQSSERLSRPETTLQRFNEIRHLIGSPTA